MADDHCPKIVNTVNLGLSAKRIVSSRHFSAIEQKFPKFPLFITLLRRA